MHWEAIIYLVNSNGHIRSKLLHKQTEMLEK